jgi:hypothetical protein
LKTAEPARIVPDGGLAAPVHAAAVASVAPHTPPSNNKRPFVSVNVLPSDVKKTEHSSPRVHLWSLELAPLSAPVVSTVTRAFATTPLGFWPQQTTYELAATPSSGVPKSNVAVEASAATVVGLTMFHVAVLTVASLSPQSPDERITS